ncbi:GLIPR1-like protein 1 [Ostrea edulis]|uniref:GLIPR1-like protein 1 n=1 Tax=Ostrea edulis TaxID=37623 RepID=UPI0024AFE238|nr:GLIPR1-like protein 1 [Ostrea edulis]
MGMLLIVISAVLLQIVVCTHPDEIDKILRLHNSFRRNYAKRGLSSQIANMNLLVWDNVLAMEAKEMVSCIPSSEGNGHHSLGRHINTGLTLNGNLTKVIGDWLREGQYFIPEFETCLEIDRCGNFLSMINAQLRHIGCAFQRNCRSRKIIYDVFMCIYEGRHGHDSHSLYSKGRVCTHCEHPTSFCNDGLCDTCDEGNGRTCDCRKSCNKPGIGVGVLDNSTCVCQCTYGKGPNCDEDCVNPQMYESWDICEMVTKNDCASEDHMILKEYCPATCDCTRHPMAETGGQASHVN